MKLVSAKKENGAWKIDYLISNKELPPRMLPEEEEAASARSVVTGRTA